MKLKKFGGLLLAAVLLMGLLTGCLGHIFTKTMTIDGEEISSGMYLLMQMLAYGEAQNMVEDPTDLLEQYIEDKKGDEWIRDRTQELCMSLIAVKRLCAQRSITLSEENLELVESDMAYWDQVKTYYEPMGIGQQTLRAYIENEYLKDQLFDVLYGEGGELAPSREEIAAHYAENNAHVRMLMVSLYGFGTEEVENADEIREAMEALAEEIRNGTKTIQDVALDDMPAIEEMVYQLEETAEGGETGEEETPPETGAEEEVLDETEPTAEEEPTDEDPAAEEEEEGEVGDIINYYINYEPDANGLFTQEFLDELREMTVGDVDIYETQGTLLLFQVIETFETDQEYEDVRESIVAEMMEEAYDKYLLATASNYTVEKFPGAEWYFRPQKLDDQYQATNDAAA